MKALLLAAGLGTRLRPLTNSIPKCLVPIGGRPLLGLWINSFIEAGIKEIFINLSFKGEMVRHYVEEASFPCQINFLEEKLLLGTGGTLKRNCHKFLDSSIILAHADNLCLADFSSFIKAHQNRPKNVEITMMTFNSENPQSCGIVKLNHDNIVTNFYEKIAHPPSNLANGAVFIIEPSVTKFVMNQSKEHLDFSADIIPHYMNKILAWHNHCYHRDIGTLGDYQKANDDWKTISR